MSFLVSLISAFVAAAPEPLVVIERSTPAYVEKYMIIADGKSEILYVSSNLFHPKGKREYGVYKRKRQSTSPLLTAIARNSSVRRIPAAVGSPHDWSVKVFGKTVDRKDPRFQDVFAWMRNQVAGQWEKQRVSAIKMVDGNISKETVFFKGKKKAQQLPYFSHCKGRPFLQQSCIFDDGFIYL